MDRFIWLFIPDSPSSGTFAQTFAHIFIAKSISM